nr:uncharacterized protein CI109_004507 [Kwoniella shandongensis]KAA5527214.1 hypothetical protein CI109_004507 [Kwoniella shandongensis]
MPSTTTERLDLKKNSKPESTVRFLIAGLSLIFAAFAIFALRSSLPATTSVRAVVNYFRPSVSVATASLASTASSATRSVHTPPTTTTTSSTGSTPFEMASSSKDFREWNRLADHMDMFHNHFRYEFNRVYTLADGGFHKEGMTLPRFLREAQQLSQHLDMHHRIEETYIFPVLAKKMPQFKQGGRESGEHLKKHKKIHDGIDKYDKYLKEGLANPSKYDAAELRAILDGFREVLFSHLDEEVKDLGAESMKAAGWTLDEIRRVPM